MPSVIAGAWSDTSGEADASAMLDRMLLPGMAVSGRAPGAVTQGTAHVERTGPRSWRQFDRRREGVTVEIGPDQVVLRRDAVGARPLYYALSADRRCVAWASRPTQLWALDWLDREPRWETLFDVLSGVPRREPARTCVSGIFQVRPGHELRWQPGYVRETRHWDPRDHLWSGGRGPADPVTTFRDLLGDAMAEAVGDGSAVLLLSGGIDSATLAAAAVRRGLGLPTLSRVYPGFESADESTRIDAVLEALGAVGEFVVGDDHPGLDVDAELVLHGEPHAGTNHAGLGQLLRSAYERGYLRVIDGCDGDSALGYMDGLGRHVLARPVLGAQAFVHLRHSGWSSTQIARRWLRDLASSSDRLESGLRRVRPVPPRAVTSPEARPLLNSWAHDLLDHQRACARPSGSWRETQLQAVEPGPAESIALMDRLAGHHHVDLVHPFAGREVLEFLLALPPEAKHAGGRWKGLAREAFPELPLAVRRQARKCDITEVVEARHPIRELAPHLVCPPVPVPWIDYERLGERLASGTPYEPGELHVMRALALTHRFLAATAQRSGCSQSRP